MSMMRNNDAHRGQLFTVDLVIASLLALVSLIIVLNINNELLITDVQSSEWVDLAYQANDAIQQLLYADASPEDWIRKNYSTIDAVNVNNRRGVLDSNKLSALVNSDYNTTRELLGLGTSQFYLQIKSFDDETIYYSMGVNATATATANKYYVERPALLNGQPVAVSLTVWR